LSLIQKFKNSMITSIQNPKIKWVRELQTSSRLRRDERNFVVEGVRLAEEALTSGWPARLVLYTDDLDERGQDVLRGFVAGGTSTEAVTAQVMRSASDTQTPQGLLAVLAWQVLPLPENLDFLFIPDAVRDPGNLGTILRTAAGAGVQAVLLPPGTADAYAPKVLRAGMGAHFRLPVLPMSWEQIGAHLKQLAVYLADAGAGLPHTQADFRQPLALIVGGEAEGAGPQAHSLATARVHIPMPGGVESLNAAVASAILLFEIVRQRSEKR
jgi:TrmH family RNA methyltransferase